MGRGFARRFSAPGVAAASLVTLLLLAGCAPEPLPHWQAPQREVVPGVTLLGVTDAGAAGDAAESESVELQATPTVPLQLVPKPADLSGVADDLLPLRVRNDAVGLSARFVAVPGVPAFSERVHDLIRAAVATTGVAYSPQVFGTDAGLSDRGCVGGSVMWPASEVLSNPKTAPPGESGIAITCELVDAFSDTLVVAVRTVSGTPEAVRSDRTVTFSVNVVTGEVAEGVPQWREAAATELWVATVELLRREAGAFGSAELAPPAAEQLVLARSALELAQAASDGGVVVTLPPGVVSPELAGLGVAASTEPIEVHVDADLAFEWSSDHRRAVWGGELAPFSGITAAWQTVQPDCDLVPCVAVTYDDGPGPFTSELLKTLAVEHGLATFFMLGSAALGAPEVVRAVANAGHELGSHTMSHPDLTLIGGDAARAQVHDAAQVLRDLSGEPVQTYRPPYGAVDDVVLAAVDLPAINWSIDTNDWRRPGVGALIERSVPVAQPGSIILFHDVHADTVEAADGVFAGLHDRGFVTVTVSQLFGGSVPNELIRER